MRVAGIEPAALTCIRRIPSPLGYTRKIVHPGIEPGFDVSPYLPSYHWTNEQL